MSVAEPGLWRLAEADAHDARADRLEHIVAELAEAEQLVTSDEVASKARQLAALYRISIREWRNEAQRLRTAGEEVAAA